MNRYTNITWIVDTHMEKNVYLSYPFIAKAAESLGAKVASLSYKDGSIIGLNSENYFNKTLNTVVYGSIQFCNKIKRTEHFDYVNGLFFNDNVKKYHLYASHLAEFLLNDDYIILPYAEVKRRKLSSGQSFFIKPNSGLKEFTGKVINSDNFDFEINSMNQIERVFPEELCVISSVKKIDAEFRYVIVDGEVITGSEYRWDNSMDVRIDTLPICDELAEKIARHPWQADDIYVADIAYTNGEAKLIELNAFSSSGMYACDTNKIVEAVSNFMIDQYY